MLSLFRRPRGPQKKAAEALYAQIVAEARAPHFYAEMGVPDTVDGRFDMILLHSFIAMQGLKARGEGRLAQAVYDVLFVDMDRALMEMGIGDMRIGKHIRKMQKAFNGRMHAYEAAIHDRDAMMQAVRRNVYGTVVDENIVTAQLEKMVEIIEDKITHAYAATQDRKVS